MRKLIFSKRISLLIAVLFCFIACKNDDDSSSSRSVNQFIYEGLDLYYLYKDDQPLFNESFNAVNEGTPEAFFEKMTIPEDRFSWIVSDYNVLEASFEGTSLTEGMDFNLTYADETQYDIFGIVNYVAKGSNAELVGIKRGDIFNTINGKSINIDNYSNLLDLENYTLDRLNYDETNGLEYIETVSLTKEEFTENPIGEAKVLDVDGKKIGYLLYNSFIGGSEEDLNLEFGKFKSEGITDLVLDLRYNGGGSVTTAIALSGMITGQFKGEVFVKEQWNSEAQAFFESDEPESLLSFFSDKTAEQETPLNSLALSKLYVISSYRTASASEMIINSLSPYIEVIHIGENDGTVGKSQASRTLYDSPNFSKEDLNTAHTYAMQPLIFKSINANNISVPFDGLLPDVIAEEDITNLGVLGNENEPLLATALNVITGNNLAAKKLRSNVFGKPFSSNKVKSPLYQKMYE